MEMDLQASGYSDSVKLLSCLMQTLDNTIFLSPKKGKFAVIILSSSSWTKVGSMQSVLWERRIKLYQMPLFMGTRTELEEGNLG